MLSHACTRLVVRSALVAIALVAASCGSSADIEVTLNQWNEEGEALSSALGPHIGTGPELSDPEGVNTYGEIGLENWSNKPIKVLEIIPDVRSGQLDILNVRVLDGSREAALFDVVGGNAADVFPESVPLDEFVFEPLGDWQPDGARQLGDEVLISFRNGSQTEDLYVYGFIVRYEIDGEERELLLDAHSFVSCLDTTPVNSCGEAESAAWPEDS